MAIDERPKTGYTYAMGLGYRRDGIHNPEMPNMCRYSLDYYAQGTASSSAAASTSAASSSSQVVSQRRQITSSAADRSYAYDHDDGEENFIQQRRSFRQSSARPEPSSPMFMSGLHAVSNFIKRSVRVVTSTTTTTNHLNHATDEEDSDVNTSRTLVNGRITPESRSGSGTEFSDLKNSSGRSGAYSASRGDQTSLSATSSMRREQGYIRKPDAVGNGVYYNGHHSFSHPLERSTRTASTAQSVFDTVRQRFIDVVTKTTTTVTNIFNQTDDNTTGEHRNLTEKRPRRSRWALCCWCLPLLLLPLLLGLLPAFWRSAETGAGSNTTVIDRFYGGLWPALWGMGRDATVVHYHFNGTNLTRQELEEIIQWKFNQLPVAKNCCDDLEHIRSQTKLLVDRINDLSKTSSERETHRLNDEVRNRQSLEWMRQSLEKLRLFVIKLEEDAKTPREEYVPKVVQERERFTLDDVRILIAQMIKRYDEDKIGEPDHALESAGGTVISTRCTEDYKWGHAQFSLFGIPLWTWTTSPRLAIQDDIRPGQCWAFKNHTGFLVLKLAGLVRPTSFTIDHLPRNLSPTGKIDSAPRNFRVLGLLSEQGPPVLLGEYEYLDNDESLQNFQIQTKLEPTQSFGYIELDITSNHGNRDYTCLYRFRVHGVMMQRGNF
ncbi:uncharacterized protein LOC129582489 isoform X2 [Paramacrobiotus metropolitanus]|uniref:uncharacterized protein LOC129582489 isoform X2 n=1 Tax=Paramacrobiotus metropolitanus TaxID=2943436 RepID=UPI002445F3F0|nr:uncharacterized protein LOC129582489 isoform X2 [Paramacrobiotus metropolitanus]